MLRTYINAYDSHDDTVEVLVEAPIIGPAVFKGTDPIDSYRGLRDSHM